MRSENGIDDAADALTLLQAVYRNPEVALAVRMRAAAIAIPFETPKLAVTTNISNENFAAMLDKAIARSQGRNAPAQLELRAEPEPS
jgi:hypothetical protein